MPDRKILKNIANIIFNYLFFSFASNLNNSKYNHISVTSKPKAPYHSIYFGAPFSDPSSMKSKSITKFNAAIITIPKDKPILNIDVLLGLNKEIPEPKKLMIKLIK